MRIHRNVLVYGSMSLRLLANQSVRLDFIQLMRRIIGGPALPQHEAAPLDIAVPEGLYLHDFNAPAVLLTGSPTLLVLERCRCSRFCLLQLIIALMPQSQHEDELDHV